MNSLSMLLSVPCILWRPSTRVKVETSSLKGHVLLTLIRACITNANANANANVKTLFHKGNTQQ